MFIAIELNSIKIIKILKIKKRLEKCNMNFIQICNHIFVNLSNVLIFVIFNSETIRFSMKISLSLREKTIEKNNSKGNIT